MIKNIFINLLLVLSIICHVEADRRPYDEVVSLGQGCQVAWQIETNNMRKYAYPFDWFITSFDSLLLFIVHKGANFLDFDKIAVGEAYPGDPSRLQVIDLVYGIQSYHDFFSMPPLGNYYEIKAKYDRRIKRFFKLLESSHKILFIREGLSKAQVEYLDYILHSLYPHLSYTILALNNSQDYLYDWGLERIRNFYLEQIPGNWMGDFVRWKEILSQFPVITPSTPRSPEERW